MPKLFWVPIESLEERYSSQWNRWFKNEFTKRSINHCMIYGTSLTDKIRTGSFLDVIGTNYFKASQLKGICLLFEQKQVEDGDIFFFHDGWFPGIEMLAYIRDALEIDFKIYSIFHAGTYDPHDFLTQKGMLKWAHHSENSWIELNDGIFVGTQFHKELLIKGVGEAACCPDKIHVTGLPIYSKFVNSQIGKEKIIVFPHRLDPEKQPEIFDQLKKDLSPSFPDYQFVKSKEVCKTKQEYYDLLNKSKISVSCALQETWGIAMMESILCGCIPIVPNRLSYSELYLDYFKYNGTYEELKEKVIWAIKNYNKILTSNELIHQKAKLILRGNVAIRKMLEIMDLL